MKNNNKSGVPLECYLCSKFDYICLFVSTSYPFFSNSTLKITLVSHFDSYTVKLNIKIILKIYHADSHFCRVFSMSYNRYSCYGWSKE